MNKLIEIKGAGHVPQQQLIGGSLRPLYTGCSLQAGVHNLSEGKEYLEAMLEFFVT